MSRDKSPFTQLFSGSPFEALAQHAREMEKSAGLLELFLEASQAGDTARSESLYEEIVSHENGADDLKDEIRTHLPQTLLLPVPRAELLTLVGLQDRVINRIRDISGLMLGRRMQFPEPVAEPFQQLALTAIESARQAANAVAGLDNALASGFGRSASDALKTQIVELERLEKRADREQITLRTRMMALENSLPPLEAMFLYRVIELLGNLSDRAERIGGCLQRLTVG